MATHSASAGLLHAAPPGPRRQGRWRPALLLALAVVGWHAWLVDRLAPVATPAGAPRPGLVQLRSLPSPDVVLPSTIPAEPLPAWTPPAPAAPPSPPVADGPPAPPVAAPADVPPAPAAGPSTVAEAAADTDTDSGPAGVPPPLYPTQLPPPAQLRYTLLHNGQAGEALLAWQHDGQRYQLTLQAQTAAGAPLLQQVSAGLVDAHGLAPDRFTDRRRQGRTQAASFRRDIGQIGYSGPPQQHPAWPGAQDRLSWLAQLVAVLAAAGSPPPEVVTLFVTDARGHAGLWQLQRQPDTLLAMPGGAWPAQHWLRLPPRPEGLRIEVWLPADPAGPAGPWPLRLHMVVPRSAHAIDLWRAAAP